ncbi:serine/threonine-protein kinase HipA [Desulfocicer vacuolatum DSM 3385]|uniref:Serine/threonine-protein kinase HipA n=1 Tax=Desulfocicer vacuolatum DSM 3385 TaxID=1121400 RepID=A0A1W2ESS7_9BACT|nr:serine/threonine-protein kinase HipA [Desulfocicer vacuolatum DSM 3385]
MTELEILTALSPKHRVGALAFGQDPFSGPQSTLSVDEEIHFKRENDLKKIARYVRLVDCIDDDEIDEFRGTLSPDDLFNILVPSLSPAGGARPKALVTYDGVEWIAKFPKRGDRWDEPLIEHACMTLAQECGIAVAETRIIQEESSNILLVKRFDKDNIGNPLHLASGFTIADFIEDQT